VQFIDLKTQYSSIKEDIDRRIKTVLEHGQYILGPEVVELEEKLAGYVGVKHCVGVASGTDALLMALMALNVGQGDEVITTPFSFVATAEVICLLGAKPVYVDIRSDTYNIDPLKIEAVITKKTKAIMPVSLYGQCADFDEINEIAKKHNIPVIEDGAQSFGATYKKERSCGLSTIGCTSFFPSKPLGGYGDGGAIFTNNDDLALIMRQIRVHGQDKRYHHARIGINGRLDTIQAAVLLEKLNIFDSEVIAREKIGARYSALLGDNVITPYIDKCNTSVYAQYTVLVEKRPSLQNTLSKAGIPTAVHYPIPLHEQPAMLDELSNVPVVTELTGKVMSLPMHPYLSERDQDKIIEVINKAV